MKRILLTTLMLLLGWLVFNHFSCESITTEFPLFLCNPNGITPLSHLTSNAFYFVNPHPIFHLITPLLPGGSYFILLLLWFVIGCFLLRTTINSAIYSIGILVSLFALFGADTAIFHSIVWVPWLIWGLDLITRNRKFSLLALLIVSILHSFTALQSSVLGVIFALIFSHRFIFKTGFLTINQLSVVLIPALFALAYGPVPVFPIYPPFARVLADIYPHKEPWLGDSPEVFLMNLPLLGKIFLIPSLIGFIFAFALVIKEKFSFLSSIILIIFLGLLVESFAFAPDSGAEIGPVATLIRILPGFSFLPIHAFLFCLGAMLIFVTFSDKQRLIVLIVITLVFTTKENPILAAKPLALKNPSSRVSKILQSPSGVILRDHPEQVANVDQNLFKSRYKSYPINKLPHEIDASHHQDIISRIFMGDSHKRWSPMKGKQEGGEFIRIKFDVPHHIKGLQVSPGAFHGDYMRGVRIKTLPKCTNINESSFGDIIYEQNPFSGDLAWTVDGYPYYESPSKGIFHFNNDLLVQCLFIEQIGKTDIYDWSVSNIRFLQ